MITTSTIEHLSRSELESAINTLGDVIAKRQKAFIHNTSALNRHSVIAGFANGSLSITTPQETELMYRLK
ncbi:hypothetical protein JCM19233_241 [Vibrio astriarenae]|nr:hypothetical protein JCM19233_241 [Vibrio sp. C7]